MIEAISLSACHAINRLYLHRLFKNTVYELLTVTNPMFLIFVYLEANGTFGLREVGIQNLLPKLLKGFCLVMVQIQKPIGSSTNLLDLLKSLVMLYLMRLMALQESKLILMI